MKPIPLALIPLLLLASCTITKRKYLAGYAINWAHKTPERMVASSHVDKHNKSIGSTPDLLQPLISAKQLTASPSLQGVVEHTVNLPLASVKRKLVPAIKPEISVNSPSTPLNMMQGNRLKTAHFYNPDDSLYTDRVECKEANACLTSGILAFILPVAISGLSYLSLKANSNNPNYNSVPMIVLAAFFAVLLGIIFLILTLVFRNRAYKEMKQEPNTYLGKSKVTIGVALALTIPAFLIIFGIVSSFFNQP